MAAPIPIRNIYYLLCYAWNRLDEGNIVDVSGVDTTELADLFATVLINGARHLLRRGLDQNYEAHEEELSSIRGRVDVARSARRMLFSHGKAYCQFDELTVNTLPNQILKSTMRCLIGVPELDKDLRKKLNVLHRDLRGIDDIPLSRLIFRKVQLHSNNRFYKFLLNICELVLDSWLVDEKTGKYKFRDFIRDDGKMARLFENFILNFFKTERSDLDVRKERIYWVAESETDPELRLLPTMETDISIRSSSHTLIIDAKYYSQTLQSYFDSKSIHSANLYQIFAYLKNLELRGGNDANAEGMLLYPVVDREIRESYNLHGHTIRISTLDLSREWKDIRAELLGLVQ